MLIALFPFNFGLSHLQSAFIGHLYELFSSIHLVLMGRRPASNVLLFFSFEPNQILRLPARVFHLLEYLVFLAPQLRDSILKFEDAFLLLKSRLPRLPPVRKTVHGPLHSHHCITTFAAFENIVVCVWVQLVHTESSLRHGHGLIWNLLGFLPGATLVRRWNLSLFHLLRLGESFHSSNALMELATRLIHVGNI